MTHRNAPLTPQGRYRLVMRVQAGRPIAHVAAEAGIARATGVEVGRSLPPERTPGTRGPLQRPKRHESGSACRWDEHRARIVINDQHKFARKLTSVSRKRSTLNRFIG